MHFSIYSVQSTVGFLRYLQMAASRVTLSDCGKRANFPATVNLQPEFSSHKSRLDFRVIWDFVHRSNKIPCLVKILLVVIHLTLLATPVNRSI